MKDNNLLSTWPKWPSYGARELDSVVRVIKSNQLFAAHEVKMFEQDFANYQASNHAIGIGNATQGLHLALAALDIGEGDEVIVTTCSWISTASCILMQNAIPVFVDITSSNFGIDPELIQTAITKNTKAIIVTHILGYASDIEKIKHIAEKNNLYLIEDASHAAGAEVNGKKLGTYGDLGVFSLQQRKAISTGDGGVICTDNPILADKLIKLRSFGHQDLSYNYRMSEFSGALGRVGLEKLDEDNSLRIRSANFLASYFANHDWIKVRLGPKNEKTVYYAIAIDLNISDDKSDEILNYFLQISVPMRKLFAPLNRHPHFAPHPVPKRGQPWNNKNYEGAMKGIDYSRLKFPVAYEYCYGRVLELYAHPGTTESQLEAFGQSLESLYKKISINNLRPGWNK